MVLFWNCSKKHGYRDTGDSSVNLVPSEAKNYFIMKNSAQQKVTS